ncbi:MAG TPA: hypothetical protein HPP77_08590, partial [Candidatus Hydrogenedentes bacterium]|nr:hypothetical protein [Candidatus Hydrogenedentota bacterium]
MTETKLPVDRLLHVADLHFWRVVFDPLRLANKRFLGNLNVALRRRHEFRMERAKPFADALAATEVRHVVLTGDFTSTSAEEEFELASEFVRGLQRRGLTLSILAGNHDVYTFEARRKRRFERCFAGLVPDTGFPAR